MSYLDRIVTCNTHNLRHFQPFCVEGVQVGWVKPAFASYLEHWSDVFLVTPAGVEIVPELAAFEQRTDAVESVIRDLIKDGVIPRWHGEKYPVTPTSRDRAMLLIDRASASSFGIRTFSQHMNGFIRDGADMKMWLGKRAKTKWNAPGKLDNMVAGGLPYAMTLQQNLIKECGEEAGIPPELSSRAIPIGAVSYCVEIPQGLKPDIIYCYDLELPIDFVPRCTDGEVEEFFLWPIDEVARLVRETEEIKHNCNLVIIDFLIRHGFITPDEADYTTLISGLHAY